MSQSDINMSLNGKTSVDEVRHAVDGPEPPIFVASNQQQVSTLPASIDVSKQFRSSLSPLNGLNDFDSNSDVSKDDNKESKSHAKAPIGRRDVSTLGPIKDTSNSSSRSIWSTFTRYLGFEDNDSIDTSNGNTALPSPRNNKKQGLNQPDHLSNHNHHHSSGNSHSNPSQVNPNVPGAFHIPAYDATPRPKKTNSPLYAAHPFHLSKSSSDLGSHQILQSVNMETSSGSPAKPTQKLEHSTHIRAVVLSLWDFSSGPRVEQLWASNPFLTPEQISLEEFDLNFENSDVASESNPDSKSENMFDNQSTGNDASDGQSNNNEAQSPLSSPRGNKNERTRRRRGSSVLIAPYMYKSNSNEQLNDKKSQNTKDQSKNQKTNDSNFVVTTTVEKISGDIEQPAPSTRATKHQIIRNNKTILRNEQTNQNDPIPDSPSLPYATVIEDYVNTKNLSALHQAKRAPRVVSSHPRHQSSNPGKANQRFVEAQDPQSARSLEQSNQDGQEEVSDSAGVEIERAITPSQAIPAREPVEDENKDSSITLEPEEESVGHRNEEDEEYKQDSDDDFDDDDQTSQDKEFDEVVIPPFTTRDPDVIAAHIAKYTLGSDLVELASNPLYGGANEENKGGIMFDPWGIMINQNDYVNPSNAAALGAAVINLFGGNPDDEFGQQSTQSNQQANNPNDPQNPNPQNQAQLPRITVGKDDDEAVSKLGIEHKLHVFDDSEYFTLAAVFTCPYNVKISYGNGASSSNGQTQPIFSAEATKFSLTLLFHKQSFPKFELYHSSIIDRLNQLVILYVYLCQLKPTQAIPLLHKEVLRTTIQLNRLMHVEGIPLPNPKQTLLFNQEFGSVHLSHLSGGPSSRNTPNMNDSPSSMTSPHNSFSDYSSQWLNSPSPPKYGAQSPYDDLNTLNQPQFGSSNQLNFSSKPKHMSSDFSPDFDVSSNSSNTHNNNNSYEDSSASTKKQKQRDFLILILTSHFQTHQRTVIMGDDIDLVNLYVSTIALFLSPEDRLKCQFATPNNIGARAPYHHQQQQEHQKQAQFAHSNPSSGASQPGLLRPTYSTSNIGALHRSNSTTKMTGSGFALNQPQHRNHNSPNPTTSSTSPSFSTSSSSQPFSSDGYIPDLVLQGIHGNYKGVRNSVYIQAMMPTTLVDLNRRIVTQTHPYHQFRLLRCEYHQSILYKMLRIRRTNLWTSQESLFQTVKEPSWIIRRMVTEAARLPDYLAQTYIILSLRNIIARTYSLIKYVEALERIALNPPPSNDAINDTSATSSSNFASSNHQKHASKRIQVQGGSSPSTTQIDNQSRLESNQLDQPANHHPHKPTPSKSSQQSSTPQYTSLDDLKSNPTVLKRIKNDLDLSEACFTVLLGIAETIRPGIYQTLFGDPMTQEKKWIELFEGL